MRGLRRLPAALLAMLLGLAAGAGHAAAQPAFTQASVGAFGSGKDAELVLPSGSGPFAAMVVLHGCSGLTQHHRTWAQTLAGWGYAALLVDSFRPRGKDNVCNRGWQVPPQQRAADALRAADYLRTLPSVRRERIGVIGFSHGGWSLLHAVRAETVATNRGTPFAAAVAYYPFCEDSGAALATDTLILIGGADDWTPAARCERWLPQVNRAGHVLELKVYPGARHAFDTAGDLRQYAGHLVGRDPAAASDAEARARAFLASRLGLR